MVNALQEAAMAIVAGRIGCNLARVTADDITAIIIQIRVRAGAVPCAFWCFHW
jgi:hypothetical protein